MRRVVIVLAAVAVLAACGGGGGSSGSGDDAAGEDSKPEKTTPSTTAAIETADSLQAVHEECTGPRTLDAFEDGQSQIGDTYATLIEAAAEQQKVTPDEFVAQLLAEMYVEDEDTLAISGAWGRDSDYGMTPMNLLSGLVYDCVLESLEVPQRVVEHIQQTRALDGTQTDSWDDYQARWTFHPDSGVSLTIWSE